MITLILLIAISTIPGVDEIESVAKFKGWVDNVIKNQQFEYEFIDYNKNPVIECTGLIIDARGVGYKPAPHLVVKTQDNRIIYNSTTIPFKLRREVGHAVFATSIPAALKLNRTGTAPLVIKAMSVDHARPDNIIIRSIDGINIVRATAENNFLDQAKVVIVTD